MENNYDPKLKDKAKRIAAGPLGKEMVKFPLLFANSLIFGQRPSASGNLSINNATATLVNFGYGNIAIICYHVLEAYKKRIAQEPHTIFQIGNLKINPLDRIIDACDELDLATIDLKVENTKKISNSNEISSFFFNPISWPPQDVKKDDFVVFGGFPGRWRQQLFSNELKFETFSGLCPVSSVRENTIICQFEREYWVYSINLRPDEELHDIGGLSGAPVFIYRNLHFDLVGIVYQFSAQFDLMYVRPAKFIHTDGSIIKDPF